MEVVKCLRISYERKPDSDLTKISHWTKAFCQVLNPLVDGES